MNTRVQHQKHSLETVLIGLLGLVMILMRDIIHHFNVVTETIVLVIFLGTLLGVSPLPFPRKMAGKEVPLPMYPVIAGIISGFMDSFLVLLLLGKAKMDGSWEQKNLFKVYATIAALIGGTIMYFGEVYLLPLALKYGMRQWYSMLPMVPPVLIFLGLLALLTSKLQVRVLEPAHLEDLDNGHELPTVTRRDFIEFAVGILLLLITHNPLLMLGMLFLYASLTGQGEQLIEVMKMETEVAVMTLLVIAAFIAGPVEPFMANFEGWLAFIPATINGVLTGAIYPATGNFWAEAHILTTAVLITPISSLVGVMLFKTWKDWKGYIKTAIPLTVAWFIIAGIWFHGVWPFLAPAFYAVFPEPQLMETLGH